MPFLDLARTNAPLKDAMLGDIAELIDRNAFINGPEVAEFEQAFAAYCGAPHCVGLAERPRRACGSRCSPPGSSRATR